MIEVLDVVHGRKPGEHRDRLMRIATDEYRRDPVAAPPVAVDPSRTAEQWAGFAAGLGDVNAARRIKMRGAALRFLASIPPGEFANG